MLYSAILLKLQSNTHRFKNNSIETKSIRRTKVTGKSQEKIKPNISNKTKYILGVDRVEEFMQRRRNVEVSMSCHVKVVTVPVKNFHRIPFASAIL